MGHSGERGKPTYVFWVEAECQQCGRQLFGETEAEDFTEAAHHISVPDSLKCPHCDGALGVQIRREKAVYRAGAASADN